MKRLVDVTLRHASAKAFRLKKGDKLRIEVVKGGQVADLSFENFNQSLTRDNYRHLLGSGKHSVFSLGPGAVLYDNNAMGVLKLLETRTESSHDALFPGCRKEILAGGRKGCLDLLAQALRVPRVRVPAVISLFMNIVDFEIVPTRAKPGDFVVFEALREIKVGVTACPAEPGRYVGTIRAQQCPNPNPSEIRVTVSHPK